LGIFYYLKYLGVCQGIGIPIYKFLEGKLFLLILNSIVNKVSREVVILFLAIAVTTQSKASISKDIILDEITNNHGIA